LEGRELQGFLKSKILADPVSPAFVKALQEVLGGLQPVTFGGADLQATLSEGATMHHWRFEGTLRSLRRHLTKGKDLSKVRIAIE
jgi:hypothetical protein